MTAMPLDGVRLAGEWRHRRKDGSLIHVQVTTHSIDWDGRAARLTTSVDITQSKRLEQELQAAYEREHRIAETLQRSHLLTHAADGFPGLAVEPFYRAAWSEALVGGDFFDSFALPDGRAALVVGDMAGKGLIAATRTAEIKYVLRAYLHQCLDTAQTLNFLNHYLCDTRDDSGVAGAFVTVSLVVIGAGTGTMEIASAGAEPPRVLVPDGRIVTIEGGGLPLGIDPAERYDTAFASLAPGEILILITDGIAEAGRGQGDALEKTLLPLVEMPLRERGRRILAAARELSGGTLQDDACILLAQRR
jgi:serine phosphatase RsbU (regulator of sigma subunit)